MPIHWNADADGKVRSFLVPVQTVQTQAFSLLLYYYLPSVWFPVVSFTKLFILAVSLSFLKRRYANFWQLLIALATTGKPDWVKVAEFMGEGKWQLMLFCQSHL